MENKKREIHSTAVVSPKAELGEGVVIGPYSIIDDDVFIDDNTIIMSKVHIGPGCRIGKGCKIYDSAIIGFPPQDLKYKGEKTFVKIGDNNIIRELSTIHSGTGEGNATEIGNNNLIMAYVHIAHDCIIRNGTILANVVNLAGHTEIEDYANIGGLVPIHQYVRIGAYSFIGGGCKVLKDVPPYMIAGGDSLAIMGINRIGLLRRGFTENQLEILKRAYKILYRSNLNVSNALIKLNEELGNYPEVQNIIEFVKKSKRGITRGPRLYKIKESDFDLF